MKCMISERNHEQGSSLSCKDTVLKPERSWCCWNLRKGVARLSLAWNSLSNLDRVSGLILSSSRSHALWTPSCLCQLLLSCFGIHQMTKSKCLSVHVQCVVHKEKYKPLLSYVQYIHEYRPCSSCVDLTHSEKLVKHLHKHFTLI